MTLDERVEKLISEKSTRLLEALELVTASTKIKQAAENSLGSAVLLISKENIKHIKLLCALCYLLGYDTAQQELLEGKFTIVTEELE